jgi:hypothetical protein
VQGAASPMHRPRGVAERERAEANNQRALPSLRKTNGIRSRL